MKAVIYARYSSDKQREESITAQLRICRDFAQRNKIEIVSEYCDRAISGKHADNRPEFQRMIKDSEKKQFDAVVVYRLDRFARNRYDSAIYKNKLKKNGVRVMSAMENISSEPEGVILESVLEGMAEYYSLELAQKVTRGMKETARQCKATGGNIATGYIVNPQTHHFEIDPKLAPTVREIFARYASGEKVADILKALSKKGIKNKEGKPFTFNCVCTMLRNRKYIGEYRYADIVIENGVPAIVDKEVFDKVQEILKKNKKAHARGRAKVNYMLSGKVECGKCHGAMIGESGKNRTGKVYNYYKCSNRKNGKTCDMAVVSKDALEQRVIEETKKHVLQDDTIRHIAKRTIEVQTKENESNETLKVLETEYKEVERSLSNIIKAVESGMPYDTVRDRLEELKDQKARLEKGIAEEQASGTNFTEEQLIYWLEKFKDGDTNDEDYRTRLFDTMITKVIVGENEITIVYNYCNDGDSDNYVLVTPPGIEPGFQP